MAHSKFRVLRRPAGPPWRRPDGPAALRGPVRPVGRPGADPVPHAGAPAGADGPGGVLRHPGARARAGRSPAARWVFRGFKDPPRTGWLHVASRGGLGVALGGVMPWPGAWGGAPPAAGGMLRCGRGGGGAAAAGVCGRRGGRRRRRSASGASGRACVHPSAVPPRCALPCALLLARGLARGRAARPGRGRGALGWPLCLWKRGEGGGRGGGSGAPVRRTLFFHGGRAAQRKWGLRLHAMRAASTHALRPPLMLARARGWCAALSAHRNARTRTHVRSPACRNPAALRVVGPALGLPPCRSPGGLHAVGKGRHPTPRLVCGTGFGNCPGSKLCRDPPALPACCCRCRA